MMLLLFRVDGERYAIPARWVVEVTPNVPLQRIPRVPGYFAGLLTYRGSVVPVLDLSQLIEHRPARHCLSTRIVLIELDEQPPALLGLLAEDATETIKLRDEEISQTCVGQDRNAFVDGVILHDSGMIRLIDPDKLLTEEVRAFLFGSERLGEVDEGEGADAS